MTPAPSGTLWVGRALTALGGVDPSHRAVHVGADGLITWIGADPSAAPPAAQVRDLGEAWLTPGFVDAHIHGTATGLQMTGVRLAGIGSAAELLRRVRDHLARRAGTGVAPALVHGSGWDDGTWSDPTLPSAAALDDAAGGRPVLLTRVDGHSCLVSTGLLAQLDLRGVEAHVPLDADGRPTGWLVEEASARAQALLLALLPPAEIAAARAATCARAVELGITSLHEMGIPALSTLDDARAWAMGRWPIEVHTYWADIDIDPSGPLRPGGDLFLDGSIGSCTAATTRPYHRNDGSPTTGELFHDDEAVGEFFTRATRAGVGAGVHAIGDAATAQAVRAIRSAAETCGIEAVRAARHRVEHVELIAREDVTALADLGVLASVQPAFDTTWNGPGGLYQRRFGRTRADTTNPFAWFADAGTAMAFSSDSTVTPLDPWGGVVAAQHHRGGLSLDRATALAAATIGGHRAVSRETVVGALRPGLRADLVAWPADPLAIPDPSGMTPVAVVAAGDEVGHSPGRTPPM